MGELAYPLRIGSIIPAEYVGLKLFDIKYLDVGGLLISTLPLFVVSLIDDRIKTGKSPRFMT